MKTRLVYVDTPQKARAGQSDIASSPVIGIDTEYDSLRYFKERLCLVQVATENKVYILDPLGSLSFSFMADTFANEQQTKVFHAAENDLRLLKRDYDFTVKNIFDTQRAATVLGYKEISLARVIEEVLGIKFSKSKGMQRSRWDRRPLTEEQLVYAASDVLHLLMIYRKFKDMLENAGLYEMATKAFAGIAEIKWAPRKFDKHGHTRIAGFPDLEPSQQLRLSGLYRWRFYKAKLLDRSVHMVMSDNELIKLAKGG